MILLPIQGYESAYVVTQGYAPAGGGGGSRFIGSAISQGLGMGLYVTQGFGPGAPVTQLDFRAAVVAALNASSDLAAIVGSNIFPLKVPENADRPALVYRIATNNGDFNLSGPSGVSVARVRFSGESNTDYAECDAIVTVLRNMFDGFYGSLPGNMAILSCFKAGEVDTIGNPDNGTDDGVFKTPVDFNFKYREPKPSR